MPTREVLASFWRDWDRLSPKQQREFRAAVAQFIADLAEGKKGFHPRLRVKRVQGHPGVWEMTWAYDGRATFQYGDEVQSGQPHIIWRRIGTTRSSVALESPLRRGFSVFGRRLCNRPDLLTSAIAAQSDGASYVSTQVSPIC